MEKQNQCPRCFSLLEENECVCSECGGTGESENPDGALPVGTLLNERFLIGMILHHNDLLTSYLAWDLSKERKVRVEEFYPGFLIRGEDGKNTLLVSPDSKTAFRTLASDLHDRWKRLIPVTNKAMLKTLVLFSENGTLYRVTEYPHLISLQEYLEKKPGPMEPADARTMISPIFSLIGQLHNMGLFHCGISPENIWLDGHQRVVLDGFALPELRTVDSGLTPELYSGYSAPEQYSKVLWQGEWTDIYSIGAVLYRLLSGKAPVPAEKRGESPDPLEPLESVCRNVPANLAAAVMQAMEYDKKYRFGNTDAFAAALLEETKANTAVFRPESSPHLQSTGTGSQTTKAVWRWVLVGLLIISLAGNGYLGYQYYQTLKSQQEQENQPIVRVMEKDFVGYYLPLIQTQLDSMTDYKFDYHYEYNNDYPENVVYKQSLAIGQALPEDGSVTLFISKGKEFVVMPDLIGANETYAMRILSDLKLQYTVQYDTNPDTGGEEGTVIESSVQAGSQVRPKTASTPDTITITVKKLNVDASNSTNTTAASGLLQ